MLYDEDLEVVLEKVSSASSEQLAEIQKAVEDRRAELKPFQRGDKERRLSSEEGREKRGSG